jgi:hypothetical protein
MSQLARVGEKVDKEDAKAVFLNNLLPRYSNVVFTLSHLPSQLLETMISTLFCRGKVCRCW